MLDELDDGARIGVWTALGVVALLLFVASWPDVRRRLMFQPLLPPRTATTAGQPRRGNHPATPVLQPTDQQHVQLQSTQIGHSRRRGSARTVDL